MGELSITHRIAENLKLAMSSEEDIDEANSSAKSNFRVNSYITNGVDRRRYFAERIKAIRSRVETFARCTGENILVIAVDEDGRAHHWGTSAFQKFVADERVTGIMYRYLNEFQPIMPRDVQSRVRKPNITDKVQLAHLRALVRAKLSSFKPGRAESVPPHWPKSVPFVSPGDLNAEQLILVAKSFIEHESSRDAVLSAHGHDEPMDDLSPERMAHADEGAEDVWDAALPGERVAKRPVSKLVDAEHGGATKKLKSNDKSSEWEAEPLQDEERIEEELPTDIGAHF